jgi:3-keto-disaccharide hydrolase
MNPDFQIPANEHRLGRAGALFAFCLLGAMLIDAKLCNAAEPKEQVIHLLQGNDRTPFYSFLKDFGVDKDPHNVFSLSNGVLHITGQYYGYLATKETNFANYKLVAEFKWGDKTWPPRETNACDSGILVHCGGKDQVWPKSIEAQIIEGGTGDILVVNGAYLTVDGVTKGPQIARFDRPGRNPWRDEKGFRGPHEIEQPRGEWNRMEVLCDGDKVSITVNGHKTLEGVKASPRSGKILIQSEGAEIFFRRLDVYPVKQTVE